MADTWVLTCLVLSATTVVTSLTYIRRQLRRRQELLIPAENDLPLGIKHIGQGMRRVIIDRKDVHVSVVATPGAFEVASTAVLFVPGMGGQAANFFEQASLFLPGGALSSSAVGVFCSWPGHGPNTSPVSAAHASPGGLVKYLVEVYEHTLSNFAESRRDGVRVVLVAHSYGCAISANALPLMPQISAKVLLAPPLGGGNKVGLLKRILLRAPPSVLDVFRSFDRHPQSGRGALSTASVRRMVGSSVGEDMARVQLAWNAHTPSAVVQLFAIQTEVPDAVEYGARIRAAGIPVSILCGERDSITPPSNAFRVWGAAGPKAQIVLIEGDIGHQVMYEASSRVNDEIVRAAKA